jgi:UDP-N-acetylglucosamine 2-epimerase
LQGLLALLLELRASAIFPVHPRVKNLLATNRKLKSIRARLEAQPNLHIVPPVSYLEMLALEKNARAIITDSGGVQKEAFFLRVPCITLRDETEWIETLEGGLNTLVDASRKRFLMAINHLTKMQSRFTESGKRQSKSLASFGGGKACQRIVRILRRSF